MKIFKILSLSILCVILHGEFAYSQSLPQYELTIQNPVLIGSVYQFDIYIKRVGSEDFRIGNSQFILNFNLSDFLSPSISRVNASQEIGAGYFFDQVIESDEIRISLGGNGSYTDAIDISASGIGTRISTFQITGVNVPVLTPGLQWVNLPNLVRTGISEIDEFDNYHDITDGTGASHINGGGELARMSGYVFNDLNGNSTWDQPAEPALNGWTINISGPNGSQSAISGNGDWADGFYEFVNLTPGQYMINETIQSGWSMTLSPSSPFNLLPGEILENLNFGNFQGPSVSGIVFKDRNGNGQRDAGEQGIQGREIVATNTTTLQEKRRFTNIDGSYIFTFNPDESGTWEFAMVQVSGWTQTKPVDPPEYLVNIQSGTYETGLDFGSCRLSSLSGIKFNDYTRDSVQQPFEPGVEGWLIRLSKDGVQIDSTTTDSDGNFSFNSITVGTFTISEAIETGWVQTVPQQPGTYSITIDTGGTDVDGLNFGNYRVSPYGGTGLISGVKFEDMNGDGVKDIEDHGISSWKIYLCIGNILIDSVQTGINGEYAFINLYDGVYDIREAYSNGWVQTYPSGGSHHILISPTQQHFTDMNFGNFLPGTISGIAYYDVNHNGTKDGAEIGMAGVTIKASSVYGILETVTIPGGAWNFSGLQAGMYTITETVPSGYQLTEPISGSYEIPVLSGTALTNLMFGNCAAADTQKYRTLLYDSLAWARNNFGRLGKSVGKKPDKVEFCFELENASGGPTNGLAILFYVPLIVGDSAYPFIVTPEPSNIIYSKKDRYVQITWSDDIDSGEVVQIYGWGKRGKYQRYAFVRWMKDGGWAANGDMVKLRNFLFNDLKLPMPNPLNVTDEIFRQIGFGWSGLTVGVARPDSPKTYGWVTIRSRSSLMQSLRNHMLIHSENLKKFDVFDNGRVFNKEQKRLSPTKQNNLLFANVMTLKINIVASELQLMPPGLGELVFDDGINPLSGLTLREIAAKADTALTHWQGKSIDVYRNLDSTLAMINAAFNGPMDTISFGSELRLTGTRQVIEVPFLHSVPGIEPKIRVRDERAFEEIPLKYALYQNYPNPFNPATTIEFEIAEPAMVTLKVFNVLGQIVGTLIDKEGFEEGIYEVEFDGSQLASGVYFYTIEVNLINDDGQIGGTKLIETKKMILMK